jgi:hypothetical protein
MYVVYLPNGGTTELDLSGVTGAFAVRWSNPRTGGPLQTGEVKEVRGGGKVALGLPPTEASDDWVVLVEQRRRTE